MLNYLFAFQNCVPFCIYILTRTPTLIFATTCFLPHFYFSQSLLLSHFLPVFFSNRTYFSLFQTANISLLLHLLYVFAKFFLYRRDTTSLSICIPILPIHLFQLVSMFLSYLTCFLCFSIHILVFTSFFLFFSILYFFSLFCHFHFSLIFLYNITTIFYFQPENLVL